MVRALLDGTKTQTRRVVKQSLERLGDGDWHAFDHKGINYRVNARHTTVVAWANLLQFCPYGQPGDRLWVRETWQHSNHPYGPADESCAIFYRADYWDDPHGMDGEKSPEGKYREWRPSIHMPRWAFRILLEIVSVRVERLQDISRGDAMGEGCPFPNMAQGDDPRQWYADLWESLNGPGSWAADPWVWVIEFKQVSHA